MNLIRYKKLHIQKSLALWSITFDLDEKKLRFIRLKKVVKINSLVKPSVFELP